MPENTKVFALLERSQIFQEQLMDIDTLEGLISLASSVLDCSLYVCDGQGYILAYSPVEERACPAYCNTVQGSRHIPKDKLKTMLGPAPLCNVIRDPQCVGDTSFLPAENRRTGAARRSHLLCLGPYALAG